MFIDLMRHGEVDDKAVFRGHTDDPLNENGFHQMTNALSEYSTDLVISSPLDRCASFAKKWCEETNHPLTPMTAFKEINFGDWDGKSIDQIEELDKTALTNFWNDPVNNSPPNAESLNDFKRRIVNGWQQLITQQKGKNILLITHGGVIKMIIAHILSVPMDKLLSIEVPLASISRIRISFDEKSNAYCSLVSHANLKTGSPE